MKALCKWLYKPAASVVETEGKERGKPVDCTHTWPMLDPQAPRRLTDTMETAYQMPCREETLSNYLWKE